MGFLISGNNETVKHPGHWPSDPGRYCLQAKRGRVLVRIGRSPGHNLSGRVYHAIAQLTQRAHAQSVVGRTVLALPAIRMRQRRVMG